MGAGQYGRLAYGLVPGSVAADTVVYTAHVEGTQPLSDEALINLAFEEGAQEVLHYEADGQLVRQIIRLGKPGVGVPGFTAMTRVDYEAQQKAAVVSTDKDGRTQAAVKADYYDIVYTLPKNAGADVFEARTYLKGELLCTERRTEEVVDGAVQPKMIRIDYGEGGSIVQVFVRDEKTAASDLDYFVLGEVGETTITAQKAGKGDPAKAAQNQTVQFTAPAEGFDLSFDSGWWPNALWENGKDKNEVFEEEAGGFPVQVRIKIAAVATYQADLQGGFSLDDDILRPGSAAGVLGLRFRRRAFHARRFRYLYSRPL